jgi:hypothetical protein
MLFDCILNTIIVVLVLIVAWQALTIHSDENIQGKMAEDHGNLHLEIEGDSPPSHDDQKRKLRRLRRPSTYRPLGGVAVRRAEMIAQFTNHLQWPTL